MYIKCKTKYIALQNQLGDEKRPIIMQKDSLIPQERTQTDMQRQAAREKEIKEHEKLLAIKDMELANQFSLDKEETNEQFQKLQQNYSKELETYHDLLNKNERIVELVKTTKREFNTKKLKLLDKNNLVKLEDDGKISE